MMVMYTACPADGGVQVPGGCNDDGCGGAGSTTCRFVLPGDGTNVTPNHTYWIRISGWNGSSGNFTLLVTQP